MHIIKMTVSIQLLYIYDRMSAGTYVKDFVSTYQVFQTESNQKDKLIPHLTLITSLSRFVRTWTVPRCALSAFFSE